MFLAMKKPPHQDGKIIKLFSENLLTYIALYSIIKPWKGGKQMGKPKRKKPKSKIEIARLVLEMLAYIATIAAAIHTMLKG